MEKFIFKCVVWTIFFSVVVFATENDGALRDQVRALAEQMNTMKSIHNMEVAALKQEVQELKKTTAATSAMVTKAPTLKTVQEDIDEIKNELVHVAQLVNNSVLLHTIHKFKNHYNYLGVKSSRMDYDLTKAQNSIARIENTIEEVKDSNLRQQNIASDLRQMFIKLNKEVRESQKPVWNEVHVEENTQDANSVSAPQETHHRFRHIKTLRHQISKMMKMYNHMEESNHGIRFQLVDIQKKLEKYNLDEIDNINTKLAFDEIRIQTIQEYFTNASRKFNDLDRVHKSVLELREDLEAFEIKSDKIHPEFRKEISKLDINAAQLNAQVSYLKEGQENLRQSVKAIAVSVSNTMDRAESDRVLLKNINDSVTDLQVKSKQHFHRLNDHILKTETNYATANRSDEMPLSELMGDVKELQPVEKEYEDLVDKLPRDCSTVTGPPGTYMIHPGHSPIDTWCVNGSTLLQRRFNGSVEFNRKFVEYAKGFGNPTSEYWMGLEDMSLLTQNNCSGMRIDMVDIYGGVWYAEYDHFHVGSADTGYVLNVSGFRGNASDAFDYQNRMEFSAIDHDRDISNTHCAGNYEGGWWYSHCQHVNINGKYSLGLTWFDNGKNEWIAVAGSEMRMFTTC